MKFQKSIIKESNDNMEISLFIRKTLQNDHNIFITDIECNKILDGIRSISNHGLNSIKNINNNIFYTSKSINQRIKVVYKKEYNMYCMVIEYRGLTKKEISIYFDILNHNTIIIYEINSKQLARESLW